MIRERSNTKGEEKRRERKKETGGGKRAIKTRDCHIQFSEQILGSLIPKPLHLESRGPPLVVACISKHKSSQVKRSSGLL
jgi:hypothetical protein